MLASPRFRDVELFDRPSQEHPMSTGSQILEIAPRRAEAVQVFDPIPILDTARFEHMQRIASVMAISPLVPESLRCRIDGSGDNKKPVPLSREEATANCFLVVNQSVRWGLDPFAVAQCCSVVHGRLMLEGKLIAAVLDAKLGVKLWWEYQTKGADVGIKVYGPDLTPGRPRVVEGWASKWRPRGVAAGKSPWDHDPHRMLIYRGQREWVRYWEPA